LEQLYFCQLSTDKFFSISLRKLFVDDIVVVDETRRANLEGCFRIKGFRLARSKTEYMKYKFSTRTNKNEGVVKHDGQETPKSKCF
jgi:hypothetical protein